MYFVCKCINMNCSFYSLLLARYNLNTTCLFAYYYITSPKDVADLVAMIEQ